MIDMMLAPKSDQLNADDLIAGPITVTIVSVGKGNNEQPVAFHLADGRKPYYPCKGMRRVIVALWGQDAAAYKGRRLTLYRDASVVFGGIVVGGIRISHASHIKAPFTTALTVSRAKRVPFVVKPLTDASDTAARAREALATATALQSEWQAYEDGGELPDDWRARLADLGTELRELRATSTADVSTALDIGKRLDAAAKADAKPAGGAS